MARRGVATKRWGCIQLCVWGKVRGQVRAGCTLLQPWVAGQVEVPEVAEHLKDGKTGG